MKNFIISMRPEQWIKNLIIYSALIFSGDLFSPRPFLISTLGFILLSILSGGVYIINDLKDIESDRTHPEKSKRPIPAGFLDKRRALFGAIILLIIACFLSFLLNKQFTLVLLSLLVLSLLYTYILKKLFLIDILAIGLGFVIRTFGGAIVIEVEISLWLILCIFFLSLFMVLSKRRGDIYLKGALPHSSGNALKNYHIEFLDKFIFFNGAVTMACYALYTISLETINKHGTDKLYLTIPFVIYGIWRYIYLIEKKNLWWNPTRILLSDRWLKVNILLWMITTVIIIYT